MPDPNPDMRDGMIRLFEMRLRDLSGDLAAGRIDLGEWQTEMRAELRDLNALQVVAAAGGERGAVSADDWLKLGPELQKQYRYLADFAHEVADGNLSADQIAARSAMYGGSAKSSYWRQVTSEADLPAQPGDGSTACHSNCGCSWVSLDDGWHWQRGKVDSCEDCIQREQDWNPYAVEAA